MVSLYNEMMNIKDMDMSMDTRILRQCIIFLALIFGFSATGLCVERDGPDPNTRVGMFYCSDCGMSPGAIDPDTQYWISTVVNTFVDSWITPDGYPKTFTNCNATSCIKWTYVYSGTFVGVPATVIRSIVKYKAVGSVGGGALTPPNGGGGGGGGTGGGSGDNFWMGSFNLCFEYFSDGTSLGTSCGLN